MATIVSVQNVHLNRLTRGEKHILTMRSQNIDIKRGMKYIPASKHNPILQTTCPQQSNLLPFHAYTPAKMADSSVRSVDLQDGVKRSIDKPSFHPEGDDGAGQSKELKGLEEKSRGFKGCRNN